MLSYRAPSTASPDTAWALFARPGRWAEWAPHVRGAWGLGSPEVEAGRAGAVRLLGAVPIPARVIAKRPGRSWTWRVGPVQLVHRVEPRAQGCVVAIDLLGPDVVERALRLTYGPLIGLLLRNLARVAAAQEGEVG